MSPIIRSLIFHGMMGVFLAGNLAPRATPFFYTLLILSYSMVMMVFSVILELGNTIINPDDADVLGHRPISPRTYFLARLFNLLIFIAFMGSALCFLPSLIGIAISGNGWLYAPVFFFVSLLANVTVGAAVLLVYTLLLRIMHYEKMKDMLAYLQIGFAFILFFFYQFIPRLAFASDHMHPFSEHWLYAVPSAWFSGLVHFLQGNAETEFQLLAGTGIAVAVLLASVAFRRISLQYAGLVAELQVQSEGRKNRKGKFRQSAKPGKLSGLLGKESAAGFRLVNIQIKRDRSVKLSLYPVFGIPLAMVLLAIIEGGLPDPFTTPLLAQGGYTPMIQGFMFFMIYFFVKGIAYSQHWEASWLFHAAPVTSPGQFYQGVKLALLIRLMMPFFIIITIIYMTQIPVSHALRHALTLLLLGLNAFSFVTLLVREFPFSKKRERGERAQRFAFLIVVLPFLGAALLLQTVAYRSITGWTILCSGMGASFCILEFLSVRILDRRFKGLECSV